MALRKECSAIGAEPNLVVVGPKPLHDEATSPAEVKMPENVCLNPLLSCRSRRQSDFAKAASWAVLTSVLALVGCAGDPSTLPSSSSSGEASAASFVETAGCPRNIKVVLKLVDRVLERTYLGGHGEPGVCWIAFVNRDFSGKETRSGLESSLTGLWAGQSFSPTMAQYVLPVLQGKTPVAHYTGLWGSTGLNKSTFELKTDQQVTVSGQLVQAKVYTYTEQHLDGKGELGNVRFKCDYLFADNKNDPSAPIFLGVSGSYPADIVANLASPISLEYL